MTDNELFSSGEQNTTQDNVTPPQVEEKDYLNELVGEGKKFQDTQALAKGKAESDAFINRLQDENATLRLELQQATRLEEFLDRLESRQQGTTVEAPSSPEPIEDVPQLSSSQLTTPSVSSEEIKKMINDGVSEALTLKEYQDNVDKVHNLAEKELGSNYKNVLTQRANELGLNTELLSELASKNPDSFINLLVKPKTTSFNSLPESNVNTSAMNIDSNVGGKTKSYYDKLRKEDINLYMSPRIQNEMIKQAEKLGEAFYD